MDAPVVNARGLSKRFGSVQALANFNLTIEPGRVVGLIGPNGAGKTTALKALLGLMAFEGELSVLGLDPFRQRADLMRQVSFIADVAVLPRWMKVRHVLEFAAAVHPGFDQSRAMDFLAQTQIRPAAKVQTLSKGMVAQLHLALVMAIDARLLILDEPTLGLDILFRKQFYTTLLNDYYDASRTILITTHQVEEIEHILTDVVFIDRGQVVLNTAMDSLAEQYQEVRVLPEQVQAARALAPISEREDFGRQIMLFEGIDSENLAPLGEMRTPTIVDLFVAKVQGHPT
jgi:ABC-2 type transport system ATP-binding protein